MRTCGIKNMECIQVGLYHLDPSCLTVVSFLCCVHMWESGKGIGNYSLPTYGSD